MLLKGTLVGAVGLALLLGQAPPAHAESVQAEIRRFPYPFANSIAFASDADMQSVADGMAIHRWLNERLGLPISDSVFPLGSWAASFFTGPSKLNTARVGAFPNFALLLRQWHRGNIDHFHSWTESWSPRVRVLEAQGQELRDGLSFKLKPIQLPFQQYRPYHVLRLQFDRAPPADLTLDLGFADGREYKVAAETVAAGRAAQVERSDASGVIIDIVTTAVDDQALDFAKLTRVTLSTPSCGSGCSTRIQELSRDDFSRLIALAQLPTFEKWNIRPFLYTSHGGATRNAAFGPPTPGLTAEHAEHPEVDPEALPLAADPKRHAYLVDVLKRLGIGTIWPLGGEETPYIKGYLYDARDELPPPVTIAGFHLARRAWTTLLPAGLELDVYKRRLSTMYPALSGDFLDEMIFCDTALLCGPEQGTVIGLLPALSLHEIGKRRSVDHLWYTHFGTARSFGAPKFEAGPDKPFPEVNDAPFMRLADHYYNFSGQMLGNERIWVVPANTASRYRRMREQVGSHVRYDDRTRTVGIEPWTDPVLGTLVPNPTAGTRDLHGLTIYVSDAARARVRIGDREIDSFTRNAADATGRESVTIVDDSTPTALIGQVPLEDRGIAFARHGRLMGPETEVRTLEASPDGRAALVFVPDDLELWNTAHFKMRFRKSGPGRAYAKLTLQDGQLLWLGEGTPSDTEASGSISVLEAAADEWVSAVFSLADAEWRDNPDVKESLDGGKRLPLPIGRIRQVEIGLLDATQDSRLSVDYLHAFRPNGNGVAPKGHKLVAGRVANGRGEPLAGIAVEAAEASGAVRSALTDKDGLYFLPAASRGSVLRLRLPGTDCYPDQGTAIEVLKDEVEIDFNTDRCNYARSQGPQDRTSALTPRETPAP